MRSQYKIPTVGRHSVRSTKALRDKSPLTRISSGQGDARSMHQRTRFSLWVEMLTRVHNCGVETSRVRSRPHIHVKHSTSIGEPSCTFGGMTAWAMYRRSSSGKRPSGVSAFRAVFKPCISRAKRAI
jgi:hypothetical protein